MLKSIAKLIVVDKLLDHKEKKKRKDKELERFKQEEPEVFKTIQWVVAGVMLVILLLIVF